MDPSLTGSYLTIDLRALRENYALLSARSETAECAAVVKADAYGLGAKEVSQALVEAGCTKFFVALPEEGIELRKYHPEIQIYILGGLFDGCDGIYRAERLTPVLNTLEEIRLWSSITAEHGSLPALLHLDSGITRLGLMEEDARALGNNPDWLNGLEIRYLVSHLACADTPDHPQNRIQLETLKKIRSLLPEGLQNTPVSFSNSSGIFLGSDFHFDLLRPGIALYGGNPTPDKTNPMKPVIHLQGKILQVHDVDSKNSVGYGATYRSSGKARIATVSVGYADGYFRCLGGLSEGAIKNKKVPVVGRVSMDMISVDVTDIDPEDCKRGSLVSLVGGAVDLETVAGTAGTISYEILTSLSRRCHRQYLDSGI